MKKTLSYPHQLLFGLPFFDGTLAEFMHLIEGNIAKSSHLLTIATPNPEQIVQAQQDPEFAAVLQRFDYYLPDGQGIILASYMHKTPLRARLTGIDAVEQLLLSASKNQWKAVIVGGHGYEDTHIHLENKKFSIKIGQHADDKTAVFWTQGYDRIGTMSEQEKITADLKVLEFISSVSPTIVFVALGAPHQETWIMRNAEYLEKLGVRVVMVVGGAFDTLTGKNMRAPFVIRRFGFEWLFRLVQQPWRWRRQLRLITFLRMIGHAR